MNTRRPGIEIVVAAHKTVALLGVIGRAEGVGCPLTGWLWPVRMVSRPAEVVAAGRGAAGSGR